MNGVPVPHPGPLPDPPTKRRYLAPKKSRKEKKEEKPEAAFPSMYVHPQRQTAEETRVLEQKVKLHGFSSVGQKLTKGKEKSLLSSHGSCIAFPSSLPQALFEPLHPPGTVTWLQSQAARDHFSGQAQTRRRLTNKPCVTNHPEPPQAHHKNLICSTEMSHVKDLRVQVPHEG